MDARGIGSVPAPWARAAAQERSSLPASRKKQNLEEGACHDRGFAKPPKLTEDPFSLSDKPVGFLKGTLYLNPRRDPL